jgi:transketolase
MRAAFFKALGEQAERDPRIVFLTGDLGYGFVDNFRERFPGRFINVGVAEQNMIGLATGLAEAGFLPYAYSIATFISLRAFEIIRNGPVHHHLPVRLVGMGAGFDYSHAGHTHHALEDVAALRTLPGLAIVIPADSRQAEAVVHKTHDLPGPIYFSLGKDDRASVNGLDGRFEMGRVQLARPGRDVAIVSMGSIASEAVAAASHLASQGIDAAVVVVSNFNPDPVADLSDILSPFAHAITLEAQIVSGGLAGLVSSVIATEGLRCRLTALGIRRPSDGLTGDQAYYWHKHGLDRAGIAGAVQHALGVSAS